jgi:hypothetical protein
MIDDETKKILKINTKYKKIVDRHYCVKVFQKEYKIVDRHYCVKVFQKKYKVIVF